jgi:hypothetical protein
LSEILIVVFAANVKDLAGDPSHLAMFFANETP